MTPLRIAGLAALLVAVAVVHVAVLDMVAVRGVVPNLMLLVVVALAMSRGLSSAVLVAFAGGLLLDLSPATDHLVGTWALALIAAAVLTERVAEDLRGSLFAAVGVVAAASFLAGSIVAILALLSGTPGMHASDLLPVVGIGILWDVALAPWLLPALVRFFDRFSGPEPEHP